MLLLRLLGALLDVVLVPLRLLARARAVPKGAFVAVTIDGAVHDVVPAPRWFERFRPTKTTSLHALAELTERIASTPNIRGLLLTIRKLQTGMAGATSLRNLLADLRTKGKEVVVHLPLGGDTKDVYVASAANRVYLAPATELAPLGFLAAPRYFRRALDRAGIVPDVLACGEYKAAGETIARDDMSPEQREQLDALLGGFHDALLHALADGRRIGDERAKALVDGGPYYGEAAVVAGLADGLAYEDEMPAALGIAPRQLLRRLPRKRLVRALLRPPVLAVIPVHGTIAHASRGPWGGVAIDEATIRLVRAARRSRRVVGVVLHVDSPGGSALASDRMHHEIEALAREKPLVCSMANVAASGGYYLAAPAHCIVAEPTTVTGSIGVIAARFTAEPLLAKLSIHTATVRRGARAGLLSSTQPLSTDERAALVTAIAAAYETFLAVVARGRNMARDEVNRLARGRVYTGAHAKAVGLVDVLGGFATAVAELRARVDPAVRDVARVELLRVRGEFPPLPPPRRDDAGKKIGALATALFGEKETSLFALAGERVLVLWPDDVT